MILTLTHAWELRPRTLADRQRAWEPWKRAWEERQCTGGGRALPYSRGFVYVQPKGFMTPTRLSHVFTVRTIALGALLCIPLAGNALAQTSVYSSMTVAGQWQGWDPTRNNMMLVSNNVWEATVFISAVPTNYFKFTANGNWNVNWGETNQTQTTDPMTGVVENAGGDIRHVAVRDGFYRFRFDDATKAYSVVLVGYSYGVGASSNMVRNSSFETAGTTNEEAMFWQYLPAQTVGGRWGNSSRRDWRFFTGSYIGAIGAQPDGFGGFYQDTPAAVGFDYQASGYFWADQDPPFGPWTAAVEELKIEFYGPTFGNPLRTVSTNLASGINSWQQFTVRGTAPTGTAWARIVVNVSGAGAAGSLQIDDLGLRAIPYPSQTFDSWNFTTTGTHARGGWLATNAAIINSTSTNLVYAGNTLLLRPSAPNGSLTSARIEDGVGRITFFYRNRADDLELTNAVSFQVLASPDGENFAVVATHTSVLNQSYQQFSYFLNDPSQYYIRLRHSGGTNDLLVDSVLVDKTAPSGLARFQDFTTWTNTTYTNNGCHALDNWQLCTGRLFSTGAYEAPSALIPGVANFTNSIRSPLYTNGYGNLTFQLARGTNGAGVGTLHIQESANGTSWTTVESISNILEAGWVSYEFVFNQPQPRYLRLANVSRASASGSSLLIQEGFASAPTPPPGWTFNSIDVYTSAGNFGDASPSLRFDGSSDRATTPAIANPTGVTFWAKGQTSSGGSVFKVEGGVNGTNVVIGAITNMAGTGTTYSFAVPATVTNIQFSYTKVTGNVSFDDVRVYGTAGGPQPAQDLLLDSISVAEPEEFRTQNFDSWPTKNEYATGTFIFQGWRITNSIVNQENAFDGQALRLRDAANNYVESPFLPDGVGVLSFQYRHWNGSGSETISVQYSTNRSTWVTITNLAVTSADYATYETFANLTNGVWVRLLHTTSGQRVMIDEISLLKPQPAADVNITGFTLPSAPYTNDSVNLQAIVSPLYGASVTNVTAYYRIGTSGVFTAIGMHVSNFVGYVALTNIPPQTNGTIVQYFMRAQFTGPGASLNSPRYYPTGGSNNPAFYGVPRSRPGTAWINEVHYDDSFFGNSNEFIEVAGPTNFNLSNWRVEVYNGDPSSNNFGVYMSARYTIPNGTFLPADTPTMGFWVIGEANTANRDMALTNRLSGTPPAAGEFPVGIILRNEVGGIEYAICFGGSVSGFTFINAVDFFFNPDASVWLSGTGTSYSAFVWQSPDMDPVSTPGAINLGQSFGGDTSIPPFTWITRMTATTNITVIVEGNSNAVPWLVKPYYANALATNTTWTAITPFNSTQSGSTNTVTFSYPTNNVFFIQMRFDRP